MVAIKGGRVQKGEGTKGVGWGSSPQKRVKRGEEKRKVEEDIRDPRAFFDGCEKESAEEEVTNFVLTLYEHCMNFVLALYELCINFVLTLY
jgi:hypothetical protein